MITHILTLAIAAGLGVLVSCDSDEPVAPVCQCPFQGDFDEDGIHTEADIDSLAEVVFFGRPLPPNPYCPFSRADLDCDGTYNSIDLNILINKVIGEGNYICKPCTRRRPRERRPWP
ncbi:MAG: hypothetical protein GF341_05280 [candidate division Zixibacteria bacterium]|nr:hypothetical protein [candidate division Zixibacteria bacterium]